MSFADQANGNYPDSKWESEGKKKQLSLGGKYPSSISNYDKFLLKTHFPAQSKRIDKAKAKNKADADPEATPSPAKKNQTTEQMTVRNPMKGRSGFHKKRTGLPQPLQPPLPTMPTIQKIQWMIKLGLRILVVSFGNLLMQMWGMLD